MQKSADAFRSIGEVSRLVGVPPHVLRYWETQFPQLAPVKRADGRRYYRPEDLHLAAGLCELLREDGMTTRGAARVIAADKGVALRARGLARLPERFRGEEEGADNDSAAAMTKAQDTAGGGDVDQGTTSPEVTGPTGTAVTSATGRPETSVKNIPGPPPVPPAAVQAESAGVSPAEPSASHEPHVPAPGVAPQVASQVSATDTDDAAPANVQPAPRRAVPAPDDLPLFPGLAPAAPPPGIWLPRLAANAAALRAMAPPRRPPVQMQHLRDRLAALIDGEA